MSKKLGPYHGRGKGRIDEDVRTAPIDREPIQQKRIHKRKRRAQRR